MFSISFPRCFLLGPAPCGDSIGPKTEDSPSRCPLRYPAPPAPRGLPATGPQAATGWKHSFHLLIPEIRLFAFHSRIPRPFLPPPFPLHPPLPPLSLSLLFPSPSLSISISLSLSAPRSLAPFPPSCFLLSPQAGLYAESGLVGTEYMGRAVQGRTG